MSLRLTSPAILHRHPLGYSFSRQPCHRRLSLCCSCCPQPFLQRLPLSYSCSLQLGVLRLSLGDSTAFSLSSTAITWHLFLSGDCPPAPSSWLQLLPSAFPAPPIFGYSCSRQPFILRLSLGCRFCPVPVPLRHPLGFCFSLQHFHNRLSSGFSCSRQPCLRRLSLCCSFCPQPFLQRLPLSYSCSLQLGVLRLSHGDSTAFSLSSSALHFASASAFCHSCIRGNNIM